MKSVIYPILEAPKAIGETEVVGINYDLYNLTISLSDKEKNSLLAVFQQPVGFRVLDETNLLEFWKSCSLKDGWAFRVIEGGWQDQEKKRDGYLTGQSRPEINEYLFIGIAECVSVLSAEEPKFIPQQAEPVTPQNAQSASVC